MRCVRESQSFLTIILRFLNFLKTKKLLQKALGFLCEDLFNFFACRSSTNTLNNVEPTTCSLANCSLVQEIYLKNFEAKIFKRFEYPVQVIEKKLILN